MGMTIDKTIEFFNGLECYTPQAKDARDTAIDTLRKYQKIQEIIADWKSDGGAFEMSELYWLRLISEVIEDEKND